MAIWHSENREADMGILESARYLLAMHADREMRHHSQAIILH